LISNSQWEGVRDTSSREVLEGFFFISVFIGCYDDWGFDWLLISWYPRGWMLCNMRDSPVIKNCTEVRSKMATKVWKQKA
jgi:hypothetical protein